MYAFWKNGGNAFTFRFYRISKAWNETYTEWDYYDQGKRWTNGGGDYTTPAVGVFNSPSGYDVPKVDKLNMKYTRINNNNKSINMYPMLIVILKMSN